MNDGDTAAGSPLRRDAEANRQKILVAAGRLFAEHGLTVRHDVIAREAGVAVGTVYRRFPDKSSLVTALFQDHVDRVVACAQAALEVEDAWTGVVQFLTSVLEIQQSSRGLREISAGSPHGVELARYARHHLAPVVVRLVARGHDEGVLRPEISEPDLAMVPVMVGAVMQAGRGARPDLWRRALEVVLEGMRAGERGPLTTPSPAGSDIERVLGG